MTTKEKIAVMTAYENGTEIEYKRKCSGVWSTLINPFWNWGEYHYRVKPKNKLWYYEALDNSGHWVIVRVRYSEEEAAGVFKGDKYRKLEALGYIEE